MSRCRTCRTPKWRGDPCTNPECRTTTRTGTLKSVTKPVTINVTHGFHAPAQTMRLLTDYDMPIRAPRWRSAS